MNPSFQHSTDVRSFVSDNLCYFQRQTTQHLVYSVEDTGHVYTELLLFLTLDNTSDFLCVKVFNTRTDVN